MLKLRKTFSCSELCTRWDINKNDLTGIVRDGKLRALNNSYTLVEIKDKAYFYEDNYKAGAGAVTEGGPLPITDENGFYFSISDVEALEKISGMSLHIKEKADDLTSTISLPASTIKTEKDSESFICSLQLSFVSDTEIRIKAGDKKSKTYSYKDLGFDREDTKEWLTLIKILKSEDNLHYIGKAHGTGSTAVEIGGKVSKVANKVRRKEYDAAHKILRSISKKFVSLLNETHKLQLPDKFHIFELIKNDCPGTYGPKLSLPPTNKRF
jgi:hypothetical protein